MKEEVSLTCIGLGLGSWWRSSLTLCPCNRLGSLSILYIKGRGIDVHAMHLIAQLVERWLRSLVVMGLNPIQGSPSVFFKHSLFWMYCLALLSTVATINMILHTHYANDTHMTISILI